MSVQRNRKEFVPGPVTVRDAKARVKRDTPHATDVIGRKANPSDPNSGVIVEFNAEVKR